MTPCNGCARARNKTQRPGTIECRLPEVSAAEQMQAYYAFHDHGGKLSEPFALECRWEGHQENAWPFQFDPAIVVQCAGKVDDGK
jgi:hypothetical protein